ncbi:hypothetical protein FLAVO9AF_510015 [Flavobacterium sp. 9AF]|uniref:hypothetical protein n=1 Tax=Flavobacterium sp. 9AF TaxID=2653142 RepID=UPI0012EF3445|nr:hypothetical protein [Flavobacterium sp. 9AF]VXC07712.1 hypothetical protein FLAVO9AF_510015 [Flavobacterium sp. 9AF]
MKSIIILFSIVLLIVCDHQEEKTSFHSSTNKPVNTESGKDAIALVSNQHFNSDTKSTIQTDITQYQEIKYVYFSDYNNKLDTINKTLKIAENLITFFIRNENHTELVKFKNKGFPMEFWATEMCPFFYIPYLELENKIAIAKDLGYANFGYKCELITTGLKEDKILTNWIRIKFKNETSSELIDKILSNKIFDKTNSLCHIIDQTYELSIKKRKLNSLITQFKELRKNENIVQIEFIFRGCEDSISLD